MEINAQALISMSHMRLCAQADKQTRETMELIKDEILKVCPYLKRFYWFQNASIEAGCAMSSKAVDTIGRFSLTCSATQVFGMDKYDVSNLLDIAQGAYYDIAER